MKITIGKYIVDAKIAAKTLIFFFITAATIILLYHFIVDGIEWTGFVEFIASCLLLIFLVEKINIKVPGLFEIKTELGEIKRSLSVVAQNISNVKINNKITTYTQTHYEGPPAYLDIDEEMTSGTGTVNLENQKIELHEERPNNQ